MGPGPPRAQDQPPSQVLSAPPPIRCPLPTCRLTWLTPDSRKRAKTEDEKEQRRVERVLRNRRAAQSSRERKRIEVEALEKRNQELEAMLKRTQQTNLLLFEELKRLRGGSASLVTRNAITISQTLFPSQDHVGSGLPEEAAPLSLDELMLASQAQSTINPTSLSPSLAPVRDMSADYDDDEEEDDHDELPACPDADEAPKTEDPSPDMTQHPAEVLCSDLQCQSVEASPSWTASQQPLSPALALYCQLTLLLTCTWTIVSICKQPLMQIAMSLKAGFSLPPTLAITTTIISLVTGPSPSRTTTSTSTTSSTTRPITATSPPPALSPAAPQTTRPLTTLRIKLLRKILTCSPMLARPLSDATMEALRLVQSEEKPDLHRVSQGDGSSAQPQATTAAAAGWPDGSSLPPKEVLVTLLWAIQVEERRMSKRATRTDQRTTLMSAPGRVSAAPLKTATAAAAPTPTPRGPKTARIDVPPKRRRGSGRGWMETSRR